MHCVDLGESFQTHIFLQNFASIQPRTSPIKFAHLAEKSEKGSISNLSTKVPIDSYTVATAAALPSEYMKWAETTGSGSAAA